MSQQETWTAVDDYVVERLGATDDVLDAVLHEQGAGGLPAIAVSAPQGKLLHLLARAVRARSVLEVGTLGGYSAIWFARAVADGGRVVTLEIDPHHAEVARANAVAAGLDDLVDVRVGPALETLASMVDAGDGPFDVVFVDADKENNTAYVRLALELSRPGTIVVVDNVVRDGALADPHSTDSRVLGSRELFDYVSSEPRLDATALQTVGSKGYDGFLLAVVTA